MQQGGYGLGEAYICLSGYLCSEVRFAITKMGKRYCSFRLQVPQTGVIKAAYFNCMCYEGVQYNLLQALNLRIRAELLIRGMFNITPYSNGKGIQMNVNVNYLKVLFNRNFFDGFDPNYAPVEYTGNAVQSTQDTTEKVDPYDLIYGGKNNG